MYKHYKLKTEHSHICEWNIDDDICGHMFVW